MVVAGTVKQTQTEKKKIGHSIHSIRNNTSKHQQIQREPNTGTAGHQRKENKEKKHLNNEKKDKKRTRGKDTKRNSKRKSKSTRNINKRAEDTTTTPETKEGEGSDGKREGGETEPAQGAWAH